LIHRSTIAFVLFFAGASVAGAQCVTDGGTLLCGNLQPGSWDYNACDPNRNPANVQLEWCEAAGGTSGEHACDGMDTPFPTDDSLFTVSQQYEGIVHPGCALPGGSDSGWGQTMPNTGSDCWIGGPTYSLGILIGDFRAFQFSGSSGAQCSVAYSEPIYAKRARQLDCPDGASFAVAGGASACSRTPDNTCPVGHPVQPGSGNKVFVETDYSSASGPLKLTRTYNSFGFWQPLGSPPAPGLFGDFWRTNYDSRVYAITGSSYAVAVIQRPDAKVKYFTSSGAEVQHFSGTAAETLLPVAGGGWAYTTANDDIETYDANGRLVGIWDKVNLQQTLSYDSAGRLASVSDARGRTLSFAYTGSIQDDSGGTVTATAPDGAQYVYTVDNNDNLVEVAYPGGPIRDYVYENASHPNAITGIVDRVNASDPTGVRYETVEYDTLGRATASYLAPNSANGTIGRNAFAYNGTSTVNTDPLNQSRTMTFTLTNGVRNLAATTQPCASCGGSGTQSIAYDTAGYHTSTTDFDSNITSYTYDDTRGLETNRAKASNATGSSSPKRTIATQWHPAFRVPTLRTIANASGTIEAQTSWAYNTRGQATARCEADPSVSSATTYACGSLATAPAGVRQWLTTYCEQADVTAGTCPLIGLTKSTNGPRATTDAGMASHDDTTTYTYYQADDSTCATNGACPHRKGDLWKVTNALSQVTTYVTYDKNGRVTRLQDANGTYTDFVYHARGWLTDRTVRASATGSAGVGDATTHIDYDAVGNVTKVTQPDGPYLVYTYDDAHRLIKIADNVVSTLANTIDYCPGGVGSATCLDAAGNRQVEQVKDPSGVLKRSMSRTYNTLSQLTQVQNHAGVPVERSDTLTISGQPIADGYDGNGNRVLVQDGFGTQTRQAFDGLNRLIDTYQDDLGASTATVDTHTHYVYDTRDNLRQVTDPDGLNTVYTYDGLNNLTGLSSPDTGNSTYTVDKAGNRLTQTDNRGITSTYTYDALNRLTAIAYPTTSLNIGYAYDQANATTGCTTSYPLGRLTTMTDGSGSTTYCYDRRGNVTQKKQVTSGVTLATQYTYTLADRLASLTYPSGAVVTYTRDTVGRVKTVTWKANATSSATTLVSNATYYPFGPLNVLTFGNGRTLTKTYDPDYAIDGIASSISTGLQLDFGVDVMGNVQAASAPTSGGGSSLIVPSGGTATVHLYSYDPLYRLTQASIQLTTGFQEAYTYNKTGDRLSSALNNATPTPYTYTAGTHHLASVGSTARTYDGNGNTKTGVTTNMTFGYDDKNRLATATSGFVTATYTTNGRGERVRKVVTGVNPVTADYSYDEGGLLLGEYSATGAAQAEYIYLDSTPIAVVKGTSLAYVETDQLGTPRQVFDPVTNNAVWTWDGLASTFGVNAPNQSPTGGAAYTLNLRFSGQYYNAETGFNYNGVRDYEPGTGRYGESDPIGLDGGITTYGYAGLNPLAWTDPSGFAQTAPNPMPEPPPGLRPPPNIGPVPSPGGPANSNRYWPTPGLLCLENPVACAALVCIVGIAIPSGTSGCDQPSPPPGNNCPAGPDCTKHRHGN